MGHSDNAGDAVEGGRDACPDEKRDQRKLVCRLDGQPLVSDSYEPDQVDDGEGNDLESRCSPPRTECKVESRNGDHGERNAGTHEAEQAEPEAGDIAAADRSVHVSHQRLGEAEEHRADELKLPAEGQVSCSRACQEHWKGQKRRWPCGDSCPSHHCSDQCGHAKVRRNWRRQIDPVVVRSTNPVSEFEQDVWNCHPVADIGSKEEVFKVPSEELGVEHRKKHPFVPKEPPMAIKEEQNCRPQQQREHVRVERGPVA